MARHRRHTYRRSRPLTKEDKIKLAIVAVVFVVCFVGYFVYGFFTNCVFHWPIRWDVGTCWHEQIQPAQQKAAQNAANFMP